MYLPAYSPHLNLVERLWQFVCRESLYNNCADFFNFETAILASIDTAHINAHINDSKV
jgi:transposase